MRDKNKITTNITNINTDINTDNSITNYTNNNSTERKDDCAADLCVVLDKLKDALCNECVDEEDFDQQEDRSKKEEPQKEVPQKEETPDEKSKNNSSNKKSGCKIQQCLEWLRRCFKHEKNDPNNESNSSDASGDKNFVEKELKEVRPKKPTHNKKCGCIVVLLVLCLFFPLILLFLRSFCPTQNAVILDNNKVSLVSTTRSESNEDKSESSNNKINGEGIVVLGTAILDGDNAHVKQDGKSNLVVEKKQKESCCREIIWEISAIVLMGSILCVIIVYLKYLQRNQEREYDIDNSILEFNKRAYFELLKFRTSELAIRQQSMEQDLELAKQAELLRFEEEQKCFEHKRRHDMRCLDLRDKYIEKAAEVINKYYESQRVDRKERDVRVEAPHNANVNIGYNEGGMNNCNNTDDKSK